MVQDLYIDFTISISKLSKIIQKIKMCEISKYGLKPIHVSCGYYLSKNPDGLTAKELSALTLEDKAAISRALKTLFDRGLVTYEPHGRNEAVRLTEEGKTLATTICEKINEAVMAGSAHITQEQRKFFYDSLLEVSNNLIEYYNSLKGTEE